MAYTASVRNVRKLLFSCFSALLLAGCGGSSGSSNSTPPVTPIITSFMASPSTITAGSSSALTAVFSGGTGEIEPGNLSVTSGVAVSVSPTATTAYTLTVTPVSGTAISQTATVTVNPATPVPTISSFTANPATITVGASTALTADFTNGTGVITPGNLAVTSGVAVNVTPATTTTYTLTVTPTTGAAITQTTTVTVNPLVPTITSFSASPATITAGQSTSLTANFTNGTGVITPGNISVTSGVAVSVSPTATTIYTLTVTPVSGAAITQTTTVTVNPAAPTITSFSASPATITAGQSTSLTANFTNGTGVITPGNISVTSGVAVSVSPTATTIYTLTVTPVSGAAITQTTTVTVNPAVPTITSFSASPATITDGSSSSLTAVFANGTGVITPGNISVTSGVAVSVSPTATTIYTLTVTPVSGAAITQTTTVTVNPLTATITSFSASPATITAGSSTSLTAVFANGTGVITPGNLSVTSGTAVSVSPAATTIYTLTVTPTSGTAVTKTTTVTVNPAATPTITSFSANPATITAGASSALTAVFANGTGVITPGNLSVTSGTAVNVTPAATTIYTLTVTPATGTAITQTTTVTVNAASPYLIPDGTYTITSKRGGLVVAVLNSAATAGANLDQETSIGAGNQIWQVTNLGNNYVELSNVVSGLAIEDPGSSTTHGLLLDQAPYGSGTNQIWQVVSNSGYIILLNEYSNLAMDVYGDSTNVGAEIDQWPESFTDNQYWTFSPAPYTPPSVTSVTISPKTGTATVGGTLSFTAQVNGTGAVTNTVSWTIAAPASSTLSPGTINPGAASSTGLATAVFNTPYPAPASVTITATSTQDPTKSATATVTLTTPAASTGPALTVDAGNQLHAISPLIYGINGNNNPQIAQVAQDSGVTLDRWGGDGATRYNYQVDQYNSAGDWWYENNGTGTKDNSGFNQQVVADAANGMKTLGTVPLIGYTTNGTGACSYSIAKYGPQQPHNGLTSEPSNSDCGYGVSVATGQNVVNDPTDTSMAIDETWTSGWVQYLAGKFGSAGNGGVAIYDLDNEPADWSGVHKDIHPLPFTYDELSSKGLSYAAAIKAADPTAQVSGPVMDNWWDYFYSAKDVYAGYGQGPCYKPWSNPIDRMAHGGTPFLAYYLQQFAAYAAAHNGARLLDYLDIHGYYAAHPNGNGVAFALAADTSIQEARVDSTRAFWDPTYTDSYYTIPNYSTDPNYVNPNTTCNPPLQPLQLIPFLKSLAANNYPGTKVAIDEYNWGAQDTINGAIAQADILGIFGAQGLDLGALWPGTNDPTQEFPIMEAFAIYRNYDGNKSTFGDTALASVTGDQSKLAVYGALRTADKTVTIVVINKTYGDLTATLGLNNMTPNGKAQVYQYSNANLQSIVQQPSLTVTPPPNGSTNSSLSATFPAQSITLLVIPKQ